MDLCQTLAVTVHFLIAFTAFLLEHKHLVTFNVIKYSSFNNCAINVRSANFNNTLVVG